MDIREHCKGKHVCITLVPESDEEVNVLRAFMLFYEANPEGMVDIQRVDVGLHITLVEPQ